MPSLQIRGTFGIVGRGRRDKVRQFSMRDASGGAFKMIQASGCRHGTMNEYFVVLVREPAAVRSESNKVVPIVSEGRDRDKAHAARGYEEDIFEGQLMTRAEAKVNLVDSCGTRGRPVETLDGVGVNGPQVLEVRTLRGDMIRGSRVQDERAVRGPSNESASYLRDHKRQNGVRGSRS
jgi:hypothetical protein